MTKLFKQEAPTAQCLSSFTISQAALDLLQGQARSDLDAHVATCNDCAERLREERVELEAAKLERIPERLQRLAQAKSSKPAERWLWLSLGGTVASLAVIGLVILNQHTIQDASETGSRGVDGVDRIGGLQTTRLKGRLGLEADVYRNGELVHEAKTLEEIHDWKIGDEIELRLVGSAGQWVLIQGWGGQGWETYFDDLSPEGGRLGLTLSITEQSQTRIRVTLCKSEAELHSCKIHPNECVSCTQRVYDLNPSP